MAGTVLVTGGTGFIASWCIVQLLERGYDVRTTVRDAGKEQRCVRVIAVAPQDLVVNSDLFFGTIEPSEGHRLVEKRNDGPAAKLDVGLSIKTAHDLVVAGYLLLRTPQTSER